MHLTQEYKKMLAPEETIRFLQELVQIPSINGQEEAIGLYLHDFFQKHGWESTVYEVEPHRPAVVVLLHGKHPGKTVMFTTHYDTHVVDNMEIPPFTPDIRDFLLYGRGSCDAKGSIAAMIMSALLLWRSGEDFSGTLMLAFVPDEEYLNKGTTWLMEHGVTADIAVVGEPTRMDVGFGHRGCTHLDVITKGKAYHSAYPERGINAIEKMASVITHLRNDFFPSYEDRTHPFLGHPVINLGIITGGTRIHTVADSCTASFLRRDLPGETTEQILAEIQEYVDSLKTQDPGLAAEVKLSTIQQRIRLPFFIDPDHPLVQAMSDSYCHITGKEGRKSVMNYYCDASILCTEHNIPTIIFGPGDIHVAHSSLEYIDIRDLCDAAYIYADFALSQLTDNTAPEEKEPSV